MDTTQTTPTWFLAVVGGTLGLLTIGVGLEVYLCLRVLARITELSL